MVNVGILLLAAVVAFALTAVLGFIVIPWLHKLKFGQTILDIGPNWHKKKQGTPNMGGIQFIIGILLAIAIACAVSFLTGGSPIVGDLLFDEASEMKTKLLAGVLMAFCFGLVGFSDDYIKVVKKRNKGLSIGQKTVAQLFICIAYTASLFFAMKQQPYMLLPFIGKVELGWFYWIFVPCVLYAATNAVNFTDGIDGLCSSVTVTAAVALCVIAVMRKAAGASILSAALAGGCAGFLVWNWNPAKVFMGDSGSLFLGGMICAIAFALDMPLLLILVGILYVIEGMSDVLQIGYFKITHGKRIFKMAPIHHHFEMCGWKEKKIVFVFSFVNIIGCVAGILCVYFGF